MSTATTASIGNRSAINAHGYGGAISSMMRRIYHMQDRAAKSLLPRMVAEYDAKRMIKDMRRKSSVKAGFDEQATIVSLPPKNSKARQELMAKVFSEISDRKITYVQAYRMYGVKRHQLVVHATKLGVELPKLGRGKNNGDTADKIRALIDMGMKNQEIADKINTAKSYVRQVRKDYTGKAEPIAANKRDKIVELLQQGLSVEQIKQQSGAEHTYVMSTMRQYGWRAPSLAGRVSPMRGKVMALIKQGLSVAEAAKAVGLSEDGARYHVDAERRKAAK